MKSNRWEPMKLPMTFNDYESCLIREAAKKVIACYGMWDPKDTRILNKDHRRIVELAVLAYCRAVIKAGKTENCPVMAELRPETDSENMDRVAWSLPTAATQQKAVATLGGLTAAELRYCEAEAMDAASRYLCGLNSRPAGGSIPPPAPVLFFMQLTCVMETSLLMRASMILMRHTSTSPARCVNKAAYFVIDDVVEADGGFPVVAQSTIDSDMQVTVTPIVSAGYKGQTNITGNVEKTRAMMIVVARMNPNSKYSLSTGNRWPVAMPATGLGVSRGTGMGPFRPSPLDRMAAKLNFWNFVEQVAERMVRSRHSSTGFIKKSWIDLRVIIQQFSLGKNPNPFGGGMITNYSDVSPAKEGSPLAVCRVSNNLGTGYETTKELSEKYNDANHRIAEPRIRNAINREFSERVKYADKQEWAKDEPELRALGVLVKP